VVIDTPADIDCVEYFIGTVDMRLHNA
jgi:hypothetical protein